MNGLQRRMAAAVLVVGGLAGLAAPAHAADKVDDSRITFPVVVAGLDNPCTPEYDDIALSGTGHAFTKMWVAEDGSSRGRTHLGIHVSGQAADGTGYVGTDSFDAQTRIEDGVAYIQMRARTAGHFTKYYNLEPRPLAGLGASLFVLDYLGGNFYNGGSFVVGEDLQLVGVGVVFLVEDAPSAVAPSRSPPPTPRGDEPGRGCTHQLQ